MPTESKKRISGTAQTTDAAATPITWALDDGSTTTELPVPVNSGLIVTLKLIAVDPGSGNMAIWNISAGVKRGAASLIVIGSPDVVPFKDVGAATWNPIFAGTNGAFKVNVTGAIGANIQWRAELVYILFQP